MSCKASTRLLYFGKVLWKGYGFENEQRIVQVNEPPAPA